MKYNLYVCITGLLIILVLVAFNTSAQERISVHDPVMIKEGDTYHLFCTGMGISHWSSKDMKAWKQEKAVFETPPQWAIDAVHGYKGHTWAPDIAFHNGTYYLYYSVSAFGKNTSCIGVATNKTLNPSSPDYKWTDHGKVIESVLGRDLWNAIDPNLVFDDAGQPWLNFGSFWGGLKLVKMNPNLLEVAEPQVWHTISKRERSFKTHDYNAGEGAVEAPFIFKKGGYYYLFVSFDYCCMGKESTYKIVVGRSEKVEGPYVDKDGIQMDQGGGSLVLEGNSDWHGVGHNSTYTFNGKDYLVFHGYDASDERGRSKLLIKEITWDQQKWPVVTW